MSKNKPKETIEYVVRLQDKERELLSQIVDTRAFSNVATPIVDLLKDVTGMATVISIIFLLFPRLFQNPVTGEYYTIAEITQAEENGGLSDYLETQNLLAVGAGITIGIGGAIATGGTILIPALIGALIGTVAVEGAEEIVKDIESATNSAKTFAVYQSRWLLFVEKVAPGTLPGGERLAR